MSELLEKQKQFGRMVPGLLEYITACGYDYTLGWLQRSEEDAERYGFRDSLHVLKLAIDVTIFDKTDSSKPLTDSQDYAFAGEYWERMGGAWGGRFSKPDGDHFSVTYMGRK
jgi:hypothetical protein